MLGIFRSVCSFNADVRRCCTSRACLSVLHVFFIPIPEAENTQRSQLIPSTTLKSHSKTEACYIRVAFTHPLLNIYLFKKDQINQFNNFRTTGFKNLIDLILFYCKVIIFYFTLVHSILQFIIFTVQCIV